MFGIKSEPPDSGGQGELGGLLPAGKGMQALLIAAIAASSLSVLFSIGTAALSGAPGQASQDQVSQEQAPTVRGQAGTDNSRATVAPAAEVGRASMSAPAGALGVFG